MSVARVSSRGLVSAITAGEAEILARSGDLTTSAVITVSPPQARRTQPQPVAARVASVRVNPQAATLAVGETAQLSAQVRDQNGNTMRRNVTWTSSDNRVAVVTGAGLAVGRGEGSAQITAESSGRSGRATVTVAPVAVSTVAVSPTRSSVEVGGTIQLQATPRDDNGNPMQGRSVTWSSNDVAIARVSADGVVTGVAPGTATVTAQSGSSRGSAQISVEAPAPAPTPVAPADPTPAIRSALETYSRAIQSRDIGAIRRVFPAMSAQQEEGFRTFFSNVEDLSVTLTVLDLEAAGTTARANVKLRYAFRDGGQRDQTNDLTMTLAQGAQGWYITGVR
jgi:uncharacterized protein YjdB